MKKVVNINLGGKKFTIDEDAYSALDKYLSTINKHFSTSSGFEDIMYDIEARISELFDEDKDGTTIITMDKVNKVQAIMGKPSDFGAEEPVVEHTSQVEKRFFRNPDNKMIAGVASGLAAYLGFEKPLLLRVLFLVVAISGIGILPYIILWIFIPEARTASDRLAMHGEEINIESIANVVEEGIIDIKDTIEDLGKNFKSKITKT